MLLGVVIDGEKGDGGRDGAGFGATIDEVFDALRILLREFDLQQAKCYPTSKLPRTHYFSERPFYLWNIFMASSSSRAHNLRAPSTGAAIAWTEAWAAQPARLRPVTGKKVGGRRLFAH